MPIKTIPKGSFIRQYVKIRCLRTIKDTFSFFSFLLCLGGVSGTPLLSLFSPSEVPSSSGLPIKSPLSGDDGRSEGIYDRFHLMIGGSGVDGPFLAI